jgi:signal transduction histidine kinase
MNVGLIIIGVLVSQMALIAALLISRARRHEAERALQASQARNRATLRAVPDLMFVISRDGVYLDYYATDEKMLFAPPEQFLGRRVRDVMPGGLADRFERAVAEVFESAGPLVVEYTLDMHDSTYTYEARLIRAEDDTVLVIVRDVTAARAAQQALRQSETALRASLLENQTLIGRVIAAQEAERRRIARDLHDDLSQKMAVLNFEVNQLASGQSGDPEAFERRIRQLSQYVGDIGANLRDLSLRLHPDKLETLGLVTAVESICRDMSRQHDIVVQFEDRGVPRAIDPNVSLCLYRVVQEALHNIVKHGGARQASVKLAGSSGAIELHVADQGRGFIPDAPGNRGLGLVSMRERVKLLGGQIAIDSSPGAGVKLAVRIPLAPAVKESPGATMDTLIGEGGP